MKKNGFGLLTIAAALVLTACNKTLEESQYNEFEFKCADGSVRNAAVYLPLGWTPKQEWPVIFMEDGLVFKDCDFKTSIDSLVDIGEIRPLVVACSYENKMKVPGFKISYRNAEFVENIARTDDKLMQLYDKHLSFFKDEFIPYITRKYSTAGSRDGRIFFGTSNSADFGLSLSMRDTTAFAEYWCYSPVNSSMSYYGMVPATTSYRICWGTKEEVGQFDYFPELIMSIRKRGGKVSSWVFDGGHDRAWWKYWFLEELKRQFPAE